MKCFNHQEREAVAVCRACGKAACQECVIETENGIACRQSCAGSLAERAEQIAGQAAHLKNLKRLNFLGSLFSIGMGLLFIYFSFLGYGVIYDLILLIGSGFIVYGIIAQLVNLIIFLKSKKYKPGRNKHL